MFESDSRIRRKYLLELVVSAVALSLICLSLSYSNSNSTEAPSTETDIAMEPDSPLESNSHTDTEQRARFAALQAATRAATTGFRPSLEMKENVDFLLTPALLMQEALSEDIITTYPSE